MRSWTLCKGGIKLWLRACPDKRSQLGKKIINWTLQNKICCQTLSYIYWIVYKCLEVSQSTSIVYRRAVSHAAAFCKLSCGGLTMTSFFSPQSVTCIDKWNTDLADEETHSNVQRFCFFGGEINCSQIIIHPTCGILAEYHPFSEEK